MREPQPRRTAVGAWVIYDIANTTFWAAIVGFSFPQWVTHKDTGGDDATLAYTLAGAMAVVLVMGPILGAFSDQAGRRMPFLVITTLVCVCATLFLGTGSLLVSLAILALALSSMELGTIFYNALLAEVSTPANRGRISGLGQGIGFLGSLIAVGVAIIFIELFSEPSSYVHIFRVAALLFLLFSLPIFFFLKERPRQVTRSTVLGKVSLGFSQLSGNLRSLHRFPGLRQFLMARFLYAMGINTAVAFAVVFASNTLGLSDREILLIFFAGALVAIPSAVYWGTVVDRIGPRPVLTISILVWIGLLLFAVGIPWLSLTKHLYWAVGLLVGVAMSGVWTADRPYMLSLTPPQYLGEFFGLHGIVGKSGRVIGPFMWGFISVTLALGQSAVLLGLVGCLVLSYVILMRMTLPVRSPSADLAG